MKTHNETNKKLQSILNINTNILMAAKNNPKYNIMAAIPPTYKIGKNTFWKYSKNFIFKIGLTK